MVLVKSIRVALVFAAIAAAQQAQPRRALDVVFVPTSEEAVQVMLKMAEVKATDVVYDLGCGDGRIVIAAAKNFGARAVGIDIDPRLIALSKESARNAGVENLVRFEEKDLFEADIHEATVVTLFLLENLNEKLRPKLLRDLKPGTRVVSNTFGMGADWKPDKTITVGGGEYTGLSRVLYLWTVPARDKK